jgi:hypothetical protein
MELEALWLQLHCLVDSSRSFWASHTQARVTVKQVAPRVDTMVVQAHGCPGANEKSGRRQFDND